MRNEEVTVFKVSRRIKFCNANEKILEFNKEGNYLVFTWGYLNESIDFNNSKTGFFFEKFVESESFKVDLNIIF